MDMVMGVDPDTLKDDGVRVSMLRDAIAKAMRSEFYAKKLEGLDIRSIGSMDDLRSLPFTTKDELRDAYPMRMMAAERGDVVRIHSTSGTTGTPVIIPYTQRDVDVWKEMMVRCYRLAGLDRDDVIQITPGYGLWTAGIGFQLGAEALGAMAVPMGPGNTEKQLAMMRDLGTTVLTSTSSYALLLAEEIRGRGIRDSLSLRVGVVGSEHWGDSMRRRIENELDVRTYDIYGLTEVYGPGIAMECEMGDGLHYWSDHLIFEIIDPSTGGPMPDGEVGELVITTLTKEGAPLIRYRTRDLTRIIPGDCPCGCPFPRIDRILGRSDDRIKVKGVNIYPGQIVDIIDAVPGASSEYRVILERSSGRDSMTLQLEVMDGIDRGEVSDTVNRLFKERVGLGIRVNCLELGSLPRSEKKTKRVFDERESPA